MISIIIPTLNNEETLSNILSSVIKSPVKKEVIVVDGGSRDRTVEIAKKFGCIIVKEEGKEKSPANAKNQGAKLAKGEVLVFLEGDLDHLSDGFLSKVAGAFKNGADALSWDSELVEDTLSEKLHDRFVRLNLLMMRKKQPNLIMAVRHEIFQRIGGVPLVGYGEDAAFDAKVWQISSNIVNIDATCYYHKVHTFTRLFNQAKWVGRTAPSTRLSLLYGVLLLTLFSVFAIPLSPWALLPAVPYLMRMGFAFALGFKHRDKIFPLIPIADLIYGIGYFVGGLK